MSKIYHQISKKPGFMKHNGGLFFRDLTKDKYQFKTKVKKNHINKVGITHGGYIASIIDAGCGSAAHKLVEKNQCVTIALDIKFIAPTKERDEILGTVTISKKTKSMIFLVCNLECDGRLTASASGVWKILRNNSFPK